MSKHIGTVYSAERNAQSPQANVDASVGGVELALLDPRLRAEPMPPATFGPCDARTLAALLVRGADEVERMRRAQVEGWDS